VLTQNLDEKSFVRETRVLVRERSNFVCIGVFSKRRSPDTWLPTVASRILLHSCPRARSSRDCVRAQCALEASAVHTRALPLSRLNRG
jgi:hypothetical protein